MQRGSPEWLAWNAARGIDTLAVQEKAERAADEAAYGRSFPDDHDEYVRLLGKLDAADAPRNGQAWTTARTLALLQGHYPEDAVGGWFVNAGVAQANPAIGFAARCGASCDKFVSGVLSEGIWKSELEGPDDLRKLLGGIAKSERLLAKQLLQLHGEATRPGQAATERGRQVRNIYIGVFAAMLDGLAGAARFQAHHRSLLESLLPKIHVDQDRYAGGKIMWEAGFRRSANWVSRWLENEEFWTSFPSAGRPPPQARARFIHEMSEIWLDCTGARATFTDTSPFHLFMRGAYGHMRGLREAANPDQIEKRLNDLHLDSIPNARTMRDDLRQLETKSSD